MKINVPENAEKIIKVLEDAGYHADIVGGCVRDSILGRIPGDYDITTDALPETVRSCFAKTVDTGMKHGTVTVIEGGEPYEVTTYRIDGEYKDNRHPVSVSFTENLEEDLARRDFTVNAMAYNPERGLTDPYGGLSDISKRIIRAVGNPEKRFGEDALRILRAIRFSSVLNFDIEEKTSMAAKTMAPRLSDVSSERIYTEWKKLLGGERAYEVVNEYKSVISVFLPELDSAEITDKNIFDGLDAEERQLLLFALSDGREGFLKAAKRLKVDNKTRDTGAAVLANLTLLDRPSDVELRKFLLGKEDRVAMICARLCCRMGLCDKDTAERVGALILADVPRRINQLAVGGAEMKSIGLSGEKIGLVLEKLLFAVAALLVENERDNLISFAQKLAL